jgi:hypothetical protein
VGQPQPSLHALYARPVSITGLLMLAIMVAAYAFALKQPREWLKCVPLVSRIMASSNSRAADPGDGLSAGTRHGLVRVLADALDIPSWAMMVFPRLLIQVGPLLNSFNAFWYSHQLMWVTWVVLLLLHPYAGAPGTKGRSSTWVRAHRWHLHAECVQCAVQH